MVFLHSPIEDETKDIVGVDTYVDKLSAAISNGAQMIAIISRFGAGKSSIAELLTKKRGKIKNEKIIKLSMWSQSTALQSDKSTDGAALVDLHRTFVYQLASQIDIRTGTYISRRLSKNYGLLKLGINSRLYWALLIAAIMLLGFGWLVKENIDVFQYLPITKIPIEYWGLFVLCGALMALFVFARADIIFSTKVSEGKREIDEVEIIDLYRLEILKSKNSLGYKKHYVVIVEDLDRATNKDAVVDFLTELRKYYVTSNKGNRVHKNIVTFIVNIMPEENLIKNTSRFKEDALYPKLFDFMLNLRPINIDNYDSILNGLLEGKRNDIISTQLPIPIGNSLLKIEGMQWIIRGEALGIREIKDRLNTAFSLYQSLCCKFPGCNVEFRKCAVVAYLVSEYESDFLGTDDKAFQKLVNSYLGNRTIDDNQYSMLLASSNIKYINVIKELIHAKLIDGTYRTYFYNYPKGSHLYTVEGLMVYNAILYGEKYSISEINDAANRAKDSDVGAIEDAFEKVVELGIALPDIIFLDETLYLEALQRHFNGVKQWMENLDYADNAVSKTTEKISRILAFDHRRNVYGEQHALSFCEIWEGKKYEPTLLQLRRMLCFEHGSEVLWYQSIFVDSHELVSVEEMEHISLENALRLLAQNSQGLSVEHVEVVWKKFSENKTNNVCKTEVELLFSQAVSVFGVPAMVFYLLNYMCHINRIIPSFETHICAYIESGSDLSDKCFISYQQLVNHLADTGLSNATLEAIGTFDRFMGYSPQVCERLYQEKYYFNYVLIGFYTDGIAIPFEKDEIRLSIKDNIEWLLEYQLRIFSALRKTITVSRTNLLSRYRFMFTCACPLMTREEINSIMSETLAITLIPASIVRIEHVNMLADYFNKREHCVVGTFDVLKFITSLSPDVAKATFYSLNSDKIFYRKLTDSRKQEFKRKINGLLGLQNNVEKLRFMKATKVLDEQFEQAMFHEMKSNKLLCNDYISLVNTDDVEISKATLKLLYNLDSIYGMSPKIQEAFYNDRNFLHYVVSKILHDGLFIFEEGERGEILWETYVAIINKDASYNAIKELMAQNHAFLHRLMNEKSYVGMTRENRMRLRIILQDANSLRNIKEAYGDDFAVQYFSDIAGFLNFEAAQEFVDIVKESKPILISDEVYKNTYDKLVNPGLKRSYTQYRRRARANK